MEKRLLLALVILACVMTGDVIFTGTPGTAPKVDDGDVVEIEVEGVGVLKNPVKRSTTSYASTNGLKK